MRQMADWFPVILELEQSHAALHCVALHMRHFLSCFASALG